MPSFAELPPFPVLVGLLTLLLGVVSVGLTLNASRPLFRSGVLGAVSFFAGWLTCELAAHQVIIQTFALGFLVWLGALDRVAGQIGTVLTVGSFLALIRLHRRGLLAETAVRGAVIEAFGEGFLDPPRPFSLRRIARPFHHAHQHVVCRNGIEMGEVDGATLYADVYHRKDMPEGAPVLVYVHGGAWVLGFKNYQGLPLLMRLASLGWVCVSIDYRRSPRYRFPAHIEDVKRGIVWAKENAKNFGGDPGFVAIAGNSAGGHLASLAALTPDVKSLQPGFEQADASVDACVSFYGVYDFTNRSGTWPGRGQVPFLERFVMQRKLSDDPEAFDVASPVVHVRADAPPFFVIHGEQDSLVPVGEGRAFVAALRATSRSPVIYAEVPDAQHAFDVFRSVRGHLTLRTVVDFLQRMAATRRTKG
jgi:acetyl esterase/lipase